MSGQNTVGTFRIKRDRVVNTVRATDSVLLEGNGKLKTAEQQVLTANFTLDSPPVDSIAIYTAYASDIQLLVAGASSSYTALIFCPLFKTSTTVDLLSLPSGAGSPTITSANGVIQVEFGASPNGIYILKLD